MWDDFLFSLSLLYSLPSQNKWNFRTNKQLYQDRDFFTDKQCSPRIKKPRKLNHFCLDEKSKETSYLLFAK